MLTYCKLQLMLGKNADLGGLVPVYTRLQYKEDIIFTIPKSLYNTFPGLYRQILLSKTSDTRDFRFDATICTTGVDPAITQTTPNPCLLEEK